MKPETRLDIAKRLVAEAEGLVARQEMLVAELDKAGYNSALGRSLLEQFERAHKQFVRTAAMLESECPWIKP